jgi:hypothetical protein
LRYAAGGRLPARYNAWVLHDTTCATWVLRHLARAAVLLAVPAIALLLLLPGGMPIRVLTVVTVAGCSFLLLAILTNEITERRVQKAGYPWGTAETTRSHRAVESQRRVAQRHRERIARRR